MKLDPQPDHICPVDVYRMDVVFFWSYEKYLTFAQKYYNLTDTIEDCADEEGCAVYLDSTEELPPLFAMVIPEHAELETYAHECSHMVDYICNFIGMPMKMSTTEPRAYLLGYLFKELCVNSPWLQEAVEITKAEAIQEHEAQKKPKKKKSR